MDIRTSVKADEEIGDGFAHEEFPGSDGERFDCFHCAVFVFPGNDQGRQHGADDHDDDGDIAGNDEIPAFQVFIEPDADPAFQGRLIGSFPWRFRKRQRNRF